MWIFFFSKLIAGAETSCSQTCFGVLLLVSDLFQTAASPGCGPRVRGSHHGGGVRLEGRNGLVCVHAASLPVVQTHHVGHHHQPRFLNETYGRAAAYAQIEIMTR